MIYVIMHGRLGNQMFQFAFAKKIQKMRDDKISVYFGRVKKQSKDAGWSDDLKYFNVGQYYTEENALFLFTKMSLKQKMVLFKYLVDCKKYKTLDELISFQISAQPLLNKYGLYWIRNGDFSPGHSNEKNVFVCGHFENYSFYEGMEDLLRKLFTPLEKSLDSNAELLKHIQNEESVCVSVRRGDFLSENNRKSYYVCNKDYFDEAIQKIKQIIPNSVLVFFSDDIEWVKKNCVYPGIVYYETLNNPVWEKVRLMSSCKHFIISNSSFSWWNQYLGSYQQKIVVSPSIWKNDSDYVGLINPKFIKVDIESISNRKTVAL